jgi:phenylalanyl-tRNA synthetase alpha subunit
MDYEQTKARIDELKDLKNKSLGAEEELTKRLQADYGISTTEGINAKIKKLKSRKERIDEEIAAEEKAIEEKFGHLLDDRSDI